MLLKANEAPSRTYFSRNADVELTILMFNVYQDGIMRTVGSFSELSDNFGLSRKQGSCGSSKADKLLGSGTGDIILFFLRK